MPPPAITTRRSEGDGALFTESGCARAAPRSAAAGQVPLAQSTLALVFAFAFPFARPAERLPEVLHVHLHLAEQPGVVEPPLGPEDRLRLAGWTLGLLGLRRVVRRRAERE